MSNNFWFLNFGLIKISFKLTFIEDNSAGAMLGTEDAEVGWDALGQLSAGKRGWERGADLRQVHTALCLYRVWIISWGKLTDRAWLWSWLLRDVCREVER